jgi:ribosome biogenesis GTPase
MNHNLPFGPAMGPRPAPSPSLLSALGWPHGAGAAGLQPPPGTEPARALAISRDLALVQTADRLGWAGPTGRFRDQRQPLCAGDWLWVQPQEGRALIHGLVPRRTLLARQAAGPSGRPQPLAANLDLVGIVMGLDRDFNPARLERLLTLAWDSGAAPLVLLTKADRVDDPGPYAARVEASAPGVPVLALSAPSGLGLEAVRERFAEGTTAVLVGSSGVGKSTLLNALLGEEARRTGAVRDSDGRGRHTTSLRELFLLPGGGCLIDTPGIREVGLLAGTAGLDAAFRDVQDLAPHCRFRDCSHGAEPGCAVQAALAEGSLDPCRYDAYLRLRREADYAAARDDQRLRQERERRWKVIAKEQRRHRKG